MGRHGSTRTDRCVRSFAPAFYENSTKNEAHFCMVFSSHILPIAFGNKPSDGSLVLWYTTAREYGKEAVMDTQTKNTPGNGETKQSQQTAGNAWKRTWTIPAQKPDVDMDYIFLLMEQRQVLV